MANIGLKLKGNAVTDEDSILSLRLLEPTCTEQDTIVTIRSATALKQNGQTVKAYTVPRKPSDFTGGSFDFSTIASQIPANNYCYALLTINSVDQIEVVLGTPSAVLANATLPSTANYQVALVKLTKGAFNLSSITNADISDRRALNQINEQPIFYATGEELISEQYLAQIADNFVAYPNTDDNSVDFSTGKTSVSQYAASNMMTAQYSTGTGTVSGGTSVTLTEAPSFSVRAGCWVRLGSAFSRIVTVTNQTTFTVATALTNGSGQTLNILEPIYTKDLVTGVGSATQQTRLADVYSTNVDSVVVDYDDTAVAGDADFDGGTPNVICLVSNGNVDNFVSTTRPSTKGGSLVETFTNTPSNNLTLVFLPNLTSGNGSVNLLWYSCFLFKDPSIFTGGIINQSFGYTTSVSGLNCAFTVENGKTVITLLNNFPNYILNVNAGTPFGDLIVEDFGIEIPRQTAGVTNDSLPYYIETAYNKITLWEDLSGTTRQITIKRRTGTVDGSVTNFNRLNALYDAVIGSASDVSFGLATHTSLQTAINNLSSGARILILGTTVAENITLSKNDMMIEGKGRASIISGNLTMSGSGNQILSLKVSGNLNLTSSNYSFVRCWLSSSSVYTAGGAYNVVNYIQE